MDCGRILRKLECTMINKIIQFKNNPASFDVSDSFIDKVISYVENLDAIYNKTAHEVSLSCFSEKGGLCSKKEQTQYIDQYKKQYEFIIEGNNLGTWHWDCDTGKIYLKGFFAPKLGYKNRKIGFFVTSIKNFVHQDDFKDVLKSLENIIKFNKKNFEFKCRFQTKNGDWVWAKISGSANKKDSHGRALEYFGIVEDIDTRTKRQDTLKHLTQTDILTGCANRLYFDKFFEKQIDKKYDNLGILALVDVDSFKSINDNFGHQIGDKILKLIATVLKTSIDEVGLLARIGGEEFGILLPDYDHKKAISLLENICIDLKNRDLTTIHPDLKETSLSLTIGLSEYNNGLEQKDIFKKADKALYKGKTSGKGRIVYGGNYEK